MFKEVYEKREERETARRRGEQQMVKSGKGGRASWGGVLLTGYNTTGCYMHYVLRITPQDSGLLVLLSPLRPFSCLYTFTIIQIS